MAASVQLCLSRPRAPEFSLADHIRIASEAGFSALDIWVSKLDDYLGLYPVVWLDIEMQKQGVYTTSVSGIRLPHAATQEDILVHEARFLELCTHLDALGGGIILIQPSAAQEDEGSRTQTISWMVRTLRRHSDLAAPFEVRIALESPVSTHGTVHTLATNQEVVQQVTRANVGLALNIGQLRESGERAEDIETLEVNKLWLVRLENTSTTLQQAICQRLADKGFRGPYGIPWPAPASTGQDSTDSIVERVRRCHQAALELLAPLYS